MNGKRITILSKDEYDYLYGIPELTNKDRIVLFELSETDQEEIQKLPSDTVKIDYILQLGYFRAKQCFFNFTFQRVRQDVWFIINNYFPSIAFPKKQISQRLHYENQKRLLTQYEFRSATHDEIIQIQRHAIKLARRHVHPRFVFDETLSYCLQCNLIKPAYSTMQSIVSIALQKERDRVLRKLSSGLDKRARLALDTLLENEGTFYNITLLRKDPKDFSTQEMRSEVAKQQTLLKINEKTKGLMPKLGLSTKNIEYYADMAKYYPPFNLRRFKKNLARLYLLCYVHQRFLKVNDHLTAFFTYRTSKYYQDAEQDAKEKLSHDESLFEEKLLKAGKLIQLYSDKHVADNELRPAAFQIVPRENINQFAKDLTAAEAKKNHFIWQYLEKQGRAIKINLRPVFQAIAFNCDENESIKKAATFLRNQIAAGHFQKNYSADNVPLDFLSKTQRAFVVEKYTDPNDQRRRIQIVNANRYEYAVYMVLEKMLDSGQVYIPNTINYRRLEDDLIPLEYWLANRDKILSQLNLSILNQPIQAILENLNKALVERYNEVNQSIRNGHNKLIKVNKNNKLTWRLPNKKQDDAVNNPFYESFPNINIGDVIRYVIESTQFSEKFKHIQPYYAKTAIEINNLIAVLIANGAGFGIRKMADISDINLNELVSTNRNFFRLQTLREANDLVVNQIAKLPIFKFYTLSDYGIHASIDGQKVETKNHTIKARYSKKYFGLGKGVVSIKLVANHVPINDKIIGANEYEGHYLFDLVYNNSSEIDVSAVSGDMHSINRVNFALMYLFGYRFMPRFTHLPEKAQENLVSFQNPSQWEKYIIKPKNKADESLIVSQWDNILRILASLAMKETTQATVVRKLSSYKRTNPTLKALIEFDKIIMSLYLLDYIDDPDMRSNVHRSLNRGEALHQLISAIRKVSDKKLPGKNEIEMEMYNECNRLIANCIIYYNATLLSKLYEFSNNNQQQEYSDLIKRLSPVAWQHINLVGKYEFLKNQETINIQELIETALLNSEINFFLIN